MFWARFVGGILLVLLGAIWIGQGLNLIKGSGMCGLWLLWGVAQTRMGVRRG